MSTKLQFDGLHVDKRQCTSEGSSVFIHFLLGYFGMDDIVYSIGTSTFHSNYITFSLRHNLTSYLKLFLVMKTLESIITSPLVEKSRESSIPSWLMLPMAGCFICGSLFTYSPSSILNIRYESVANLQWIAPIFMIAGGTLL